MNVRQLVVRNRSVIGLDLWLDLTVHLLLGTTRTVGWCWLGLTLGSPLTIQLMSLVCELLTLLTIRAKRRTALSLRCCLARCE